MTDNKRLSKLDLIVFDIDGTLVNNKGEVGGDTKQLVAKLKKMGVKFGFASGRQHSALVEYASELNIDTPLVSLDGALIKSHPDGKVVFKADIPSGIIKKAIHFSDSLLIKMVLCDDDTVYYTDHNSPALDLLDKFDVKTKELDSYNQKLNDNLEIIFVNHEKAPLAKIKSRLSFPYSFGVATQYSKSVVNEGYYFLEVRKNGVDKAKGVKRLIKYHKTNYDRTAVVGDWYNDLPVFKTKAFKVSLENAVPEIKYLSDMVTKRGNNEDGVAEFLEKVLEAKVSK